MSDHSSSESPPSLEEFAKRRRAEGYHAVADSIEYLLDNKERFTSGDLEIGELPLDPSHELMFRIGIFVGSRFEKRAAKQGAADSSTPTDAQTGQQEKTG